MPDNEFLIKITGDASQAKEAINEAKDQLDKASKSVEMLADLIGVKIPDGLKKMIASSELVGPALAEAFGPLSLLVFGIEILQRIAEKMEQMDEEAEKHRLAWQDIGIASDDATRKIEDSIAKQEQKYIEITQGPIAGMEFALGHMRSVALSAFADIAGAMDRVAAELTEESSWFNVNKEAAADIKATISDMHKAMDDAAKAAPKDPFAPIIAQEGVLNDKIRETNDLIRRRSANMGADKSLVDPLKQEVALYEDIISKLHLQKDLQTEALKTANAEINKAKIDRSVTIDVAKIEAHKKTDDAIIQQEKETIRELAAAHQISAEEELSLNKTVLDQKFAQDETALNKKLEQLNRNRERNRAQIITVQGEIKALTTQHYTDLEKLNADYYKQVEHNGQEAVSKAAAVIHKKLQQSHEAQDAAIKDKIEQDKQASDQEIQLIEQRFERGKITQQQEIAEIAKAKENELELEKLAQQKRFAIWDGDVKKQAEIQAQINKLVAQSKTIEAKAVTDGLKAQQQQYKQVFSQIGSAITGNVMDVLKGTETITQAFQKMYQSLIASLANYIAQKAEKKAEEWLIDKLFHMHSLTAAAGAATGVAMTSAFASVMSALPFPANVSTAPGVAAGVGSAVGGIASGAMAVVDSSAGGAWMIDSDRLNFVHRRETILPADKSMKLDNMLNSGGSGVTVVVNHSVSAVDAASFQGHIRRHSNMIANEVTRALKRKGAR